MITRLTEKDKAIRDAIREKWNEKGWEWDTHTGQATIRLLPVISEIMSRELEDFKIQIEALTDTFCIAGMVSDRAKDACLLYNALKRSGMSEEGINYAIYAFLIGDKNCDHSPDINIKNMREEQ